MPRRTDQADKLTLDHSTGHHTDPHNTHKKLHYQFIILLLPSSDNIIRPDPDEMECIIAMR